MNNDIKSLQPAELWKFFDEILQIPRPSGHEEKIRQYLKRFAEARRLSFKEDKKGNIVISKPAVEGLEDKPIVVLQSHLDMVCEKNKDVRHDFMKDPIKAYISDDLVKARGTTLGADNGFGVAAQLAVLDSDNIAHGPIECLFTVEEETGLVGAFELEEGFFEGKILLNLDSEDEGELFIGCAGGKTLTGFSKIKKKAGNPHHEYFHLSVGGLTGGHSGDEIHLPRANAIKILLQVLLYLSTMPYRLVSISGGNLHNAIPREAEAIISVKPEKAESLKKLFTEIYNQLKPYYSSFEKNIRILMKDTYPHEERYKKSQQIDILHTLSSLPHGVLKMSHDMQGLVQTSANLASIKETGTMLEITSSVRSSVNIELQENANRVRSIFKLTMMDIKESSGYPGWKPNLDSDILKLAVERYTTLFGTKPKVKAIHAGLECGLFLEKYPYLDMISFGPTIKFPHSPDEQISISSSEKFWKLLKDVLEQVAAVH